ncbi:MAG: hypothetical protein HY355_06595 [Armatimonadetes bacterium]|nr:hypothetical protein [Armatimonadota bacterium]
MPNADGYVLEVYNTGTGALIAAVSITGSPPKTDHVFPETALDCGGITYRWRVGATFPNNAAPAFSGFWTFTIP